MSARLADIPSQGHGFDWHGIHVGVMDINGRRVDKVLVTLGLEPGEDTAPEQSDAA